MGKWVSFILILLMASIYLLGCGNGSKLNDSDDRNSKIVPPEEPVKDNTEAPTHENDPIKDQIDRMTMDEKIGQMVMSEVEGYTISNNTMKLIKDYHVGGFIILGENVRDGNQLLSLINSLKTTNIESKIPLFLSIDQEGGRVDRLGAIFGLLPASKVIGKVNSKDFSFNIGSLISSELNSLGLNMDFAPVLDINSNPNNPVIGDRSFGSTSDIVTKLGIETMKGIQSGNVISVVKHFPGHGDTSVDSHVGLPSVNNDIKRLNSFELVPFTEAIKNGTDAVMVAHILLTKIDPKYPSSMSKTIITDMLRKDLNFDGVVITDDMTMGAITKNYNIGDAAVKSVNAGCDIVLVCHLYDNVTAVIDALKDGVHDGTITEDRVNQSVYRILKLKKKYMINDKTMKSIDASIINNKIKSILDSYMK